MAPKRKAKVLTSVETEVENESKVPEVEESVASNKRQRSSSIDNVKSVTIEHCKSWYVMLHRFLCMFLIVFRCRNAFKTRAAKVEKALKDAGYTVSINPSKPRKGAFVITREGKETPIIELLDMPRPFTKLKNLDIDEVIADILA